MPAPAKKQKLPKFITKARKYGKKAVPARHIGELGTPELHRHHHVVEEARDYTANGQVRTKGARVKDQLPIDRYHDRHELAPRPDSVLNTALYRAAVKLQEDFHGSQLMQGGRSVFEKAPAGSTAPDKAMTLHVASLAAYNKAILAIGPSLRPVLRHVVCYGGTAREWAVENRDNPSGGLSMLRAALSDLAIYYGYISPRR